MRIRDGRVGPCIGYSVTPDRYIDIRVTDSPLHIAVLIERQKGTVIGRVVVDVIAITVRRKGPFVHPLEKMMQRHSHEHGRWKPADRVFAGIGIVRRRIP